MRKIAALSLIGLFATLISTATMAPPPAYASSSCENLSLVNGNFEATLPDPKPDYNYYWGNYTDASTNQVEGMGWLTTHPGHSMEFWAGDPLLTEDSGPVAFDGHTFVELNADEPSALYQDIPTVPGSSIVWKLAHRARAGGLEFDTMVVKIGDPSSITRINLDGGDNSMQQGPEITDGQLAWGVHTGIYVVPAGQTLTRFWFESLGGGSYGNFLDGISFMPYNCSSETPTYSPPSIAGTTDGFTFQLTNYDATGMTATASVGRATISPTGLVTLTGAPSNTSGTITITNHHDGFIDATVTVTANSLGSALIPRFDTPTEIATGFTAQITNFDPDFTWTVQTTDTSTTEVNRAVATVDTLTGLITVVDATPTTVVPVITTRPSYQTGSAFVKATSVRLPPEAYKPVVSNNSGNRSYEASPLLVSPVKPILLKPTSVSLSGFAPGSSSLTSEMKTKLRQILAAHSKYKSLTIEGFAGGPGKSRSDLIVAKLRASAGYKFIKQISPQAFKSIKLRGKQIGTVGPSARKLVLIFEN